MSLGHAKTCHGYKQMKICSSSSTCKWTSYKNSSYFTLTSLSALRKRQEWDMTSPIQSFCLLSMYINHWEPIVSSSRVNWYGPSLSFFIYTSNPYSCKCFITYITIYNTHMIVITQHNTRPIYRAILIMIPHL